MWIRNKVTNTLQEIHNADVIKVCSKEPGKYEVSEEYPGDNEAVKAAEKKAKEEAEKASKEAEDKDEEEAKKAEEEAQKAVDQAAEGGEGTDNDATQEDYAAMKINDLRKIAKEKGIQGYNNMDKATLAAVIQAH